MVCGQRAEITTSDIPPMCIPGESCDSLKANSSTTNSTTEHSPEHNSLVLSLAGGSITVLGALIIAFAVFSQNVIDTP